MEVFSDCNCLCVFVGQGFWSHVSRATSLSVYSLVVGCSLEAFFNNVDHLVSFSDKVTHRAVLGQIKSTLNDHKQHVVLQHCCMRVKLNMFLEVLDGKPNILSFTADSIWDFTIIPMIIMLQAARNILRKFQWLFTSAETGGRPRPHLRLWFEGLVAEVEPFVAPRQHRPGVPGPKPLHVRSQRRRPEEYKHK